MIKAHRALTTLGVVALTLVSSAALAAPANAAPNVEGRARALLPASAASTELATSGIDRFGDGDVIVRFEQTHRGLPVIGRGAAVRMSASGRAIQTNTALERELPSTIVPTLAPSAAATVAARVSRVRPGAGDAHLVVWPTRDRGARLAWAVVPRVPAGLPLAPRVIVDANTGEILDARNAIVFAGQVRSYEFNPTKTPSLGTFPLALLPAGETLSNPFLESSNCIDNKTVKPVSMFGFDLKLHVCDLEQTAKADANGDFLFDPADDPGSAASKSDAFSEASIYYHAAKAYTFFRNLQGDMEAQVVVDKPLKVVANLQIPAGVSSGNLAAASDPNKPLDPFQNAFFSPAGGGLGALFQQLYGFDAGALWFGQGPNRDYAYDGDVVYHEFGHAVVDATIKLGAWHVDARGAIDAPGAMNEGLADYFSSAITGDPDVGEYASKDFGAGANVIRTLSNEDKCPTAVVGEVHYDSTLFSGALWQARTSLPEGDRAKFDAALYKAMRTNPGKGEDLGYDDMAKLFLATLTTDLPAGAAALETAMKARGVLPSCERIFAFEGKAIVSPEPRFGFAAPGTQIIGLKGIAPGILQVQAKIPAGTAKVTLTFSAKSGQGSPTDVLGGQSTPFTPVVLAKFGKAITWDPKAKTPHDADAKVEATGGATRTATFDVPVSETGTAADTVFLQIANTGESDGSYDDLEVALEPAAAGEGDPPPAAINPVAPAATDSGCACTTAGGPARDTGTLAGIFATALALLTAGRRRKA